MNKPMLCPVCNLHIFDENGDYDICPICGWENDYIQNKDFDYCGGANDLSVNESKLYYLLETCEHNHITQKLKSIHQDYRTIKSQLFKKYKGIDWRTSDGELARNDLADVHDYYVNHLHALKAKLKEELSDYLELLIRFDDEVNLEYPSNFNYTDSIEKVEKLQQILKDNYKLEFILDKNIQDASYFAQLDIFPNERKEKILIPLISISFSNFGNFVSIHGKEIDNYPKDKIIKEINNYFRYIPSTVLEFEYTGNNQVVNGNTWKCRYFNYS